MIRDLLGDLGPPRLSGTSSVQRTENELAFVVQDDAHDYDSYYWWLFKCWVCSCWDGRERQFDGRGACACVNDNKFFVTSK